MSYNRRTLRMQIDDNYIPEPNSGCWLWTGGCNVKGYGQITLFPGRIRIYAHRASFETFIGPIPTGLIVCHKCDVPSCINPDHLFVGTNQDNTTDAKNKGRIAVGDRCGARLHPERRPKGMMHGRAKLSEAQVLQIISSQEQNAKLADQYGVSGVLIGKIKKGKLWKHIQYSK